MSGTADKSSSRTSGCIERSTADTPRCQVYVKRSGTKMSCCAQSKEIDKKLQTDDFCCSFR